jgi:hypothetical protein
MLDGVGDACALLEHDHHRHIAAICNQTATIICCMLCNWCFLVLEILPWPFFEQDQPRHIAAICTVLSSIGSKLRHP